MIARINTDWLSGTFAWVLRTTWQAALLAILCCWPSGCCAVVRC